MQLAIRDMHEFPLCKLLSRKHTDKKGRETHLCFLPQTAVFSRLGDAEKTIDLNKASCGWLCTGHTSYPANMWSHPWNDAQSDANYHSADYIGLQQQAQQACLMPFLNWQCSVPNSAVELQWTQVKQLRSAAKLDHVQKQSLTISVTQSAYRNKKGPWTADS